MKSEEIFKNECIYHFSIIFIPGAFCLFPYVLIFNSYYSGLFKNWKEVYLIFFFGFFTVAVAIGLIIESIGGWIEGSILDKKISAKNKNHLKEWHEYLKLTLNPESIGQLYLKTRVMTLKYEINLGLSLIISYIGFIWIDIRYNITGFWSFVFLSILLLVLLAYLFFDSYKCAELLSNLRQNILSKYNNKEEIINSFFDEVNKWWDLTGQHKWDFETTKNVCLVVNDYFERLGQNPAPRFREEINKNNQAYIRQWVMGCHFDWLNPRKGLN